MNKILFLIEQPLDERNYDRFGIQTWINRGWDIEVWDLTPLISPSVWQSFFERGLNLKVFDGYFPVTSKSELEINNKRIERIKYFIDLTGDSIYSIRVKFRLKQIGGIRIVVSTGSLPEPNDSGTTNLAYILKKVINRSPLKLFKILSDKFMHSLSASFIKPGLVVVSGEKSIQAISFSRKIISAHNLDYDVYLNLKGLIDMGEREYAVFIDQDACYHPEYLAKNEPVSATPEKYFPTISKGLSKISDVLGIDLCIAAHPRSSYRQLDQDYFEGIPIEYGKTGELIRNCKFVLCHHSTAIQLAILFEKPVIFVTTDELIPSSFGEWIDNFASALGKVPVNLDGDLDEINWMKELSIDIKKYREYKNKYIKIDGSPEKPYWDIVIDYIEKYEGPTP